MDANTPHPDDRDPIGPDLTALERRLSAWRPCAGGLDRDRMLFDAGRASASAGGRPWRLATAALLLATAGLGGLLAQQRATLARERSHRLELETALAARIEATRPRSYAPVTVEIPPIEPPSPSSYLVLTARLAAGDATPPDVGDARHPRGPAHDPSGGPGDAPALRPRDLRRILDL
jgi:hypothetical protein